MLTLTSFYERMKYILFSGKRAYDQRGIETERGHGPRHKREQFICPHVPSALDGWLGSSDAFNLSDPSK